MISSQKDVISIKIQHREMMLYRLNAFYNEENKHWVSKEIQECERRLRKYKKQLEELESNE